MTPRPTHDTPEGRAYLALRKLATEQRRPTAELLHLYALEGFLARLTASGAASRFVLKGGVLLAAFDARRPTKDVDLTAQDQPNDPEAIRHIIAKVLAVDVDDGLSFDPKRLTAEIIREEDDYSGVRVTVPCRLASARIQFHVDVNVGDPIAPPPVEVPIPRLLGGEPLRIRGYRIEMVLAEKLVTAIQRGSANTRWRDFADIWILTRRHAVQATSVRKALDTVAGHRGAELAPLSTHLTGFAAIAQSRWLAWRRRLALQDLVPESFDALLADVSRFADPLLGPEPDDQTWDPVTQTWQ